MRSLNAVMNEPLKGVDLFDVLLDPDECLKESVYPGFQHRFVGLYFTKSDKLRPRLTCRHVDPAKTILFYASANLSKVLTLSTFFPTWSIPC